MKKINGKYLAIAAIAILVLCYAKPDLVVDPHFSLPKASALESCVGNEDGNCEFNPNGALDKNPTPPNPNRPSFDECGNEYDYQGNLISKGSGCGQASITPGVPTNQQVPSQPNFGGK